MLNVSGDLLGVEIEAKQCPAPESARNYGGVWCAPFLGEGEGGGSCDGHTVIKMMSQHGRCGANKRVKKDTPRVCCVHDMAIIDCIPLWSHVPSLAITPTITGGNGASCFGQATLAYCVDV